MDDKRRTGRSFGTLNVEPAGGTDAVEQGRYVADEGEWHLELRFDPEHDHMISGDVCRTTPDASTWWEFRTSEQDVVTSDERSWYVDWASPASGPPEGFEPAEGMAIPGADSPSEIVVSLSLPKSPPGLDLEGDLKFTARWVGRGMRGLRLTVACATDVAEPAKVQFQGRDLTYLNCLENAGIDVDLVPPSEPLQHSGDVWRAADAFSALRSLGTPQDRASWDLNLLVLSKADRPNLLGIMFDAYDDHQRQGVALFAQAIRDNEEEPEPDRRMIQVALHELGHALNLRHRFDGDVGFPHSSSFMMYDSLFQSGGPDEYWQRFRYKFDRDELRYLRHGTRRDIIPGGGAFGSARYWPELDTTRKVIPSVPAPVELWLTQPGAGKPIAWGQPVFLGVSLRNTGHTPLRLPRTILDPKAGLLQVRMRARTSNGTGSSSAQAEPFVPMMLRCYESATAQQSVTLRPGESIHGNLNLAFGAGGVFPFDDAGEYDTWVELALPAATCEPQPVVAEAKSSPIRITVEHRPRDEDLVTTLREPDTGRFLVLGGAPALEGEEDRLLGAAERCREDRAFNGNGIAAAYERAVGISRSRRPETRTEAIAYLESALSGSASEYFDPHTLSSTRSLLRDLQRLQGDDGVRATTVIVDLAISRCGSDEPHTVRREPGIVCVADSTQETSVAMSPAVFEGYDEQENEIRVTVAIPTDDGLVEVLSVENLELVRRGEGPLLYAKLFPSRQVAPARDVEVKPSALSRHPRDDAWTALSEAVDDVEPPRDESVLAPWISDPQGLTSTGHPAEVSWPRLRGVAWWGCTYVNFPNCYEPREEHKRPSRMSADPCEAFVLQDVTTQTASVGHQAIRREHGDLEGRDT